jgi:hypothetical protein
VTWQHGQQKGQDRFLAIKTTNKTFPFIRKHYIKVLSEISVSFSGVLNAKNI